MALTVSFFDSKFPVGGGIFWLCVSSSLLANLCSVYSSGYSFSDVSVTGLVKLILSPFVFKSSVELAVGLWILYNTNMFENFYGSDAYTVFLVFATVTSKFLQVFFLWLFRALSLNLRPGLYDIVFAQVFLYYAEVPVFSRFTYRNYSISSKYSLYFWALTLAIGFSFSSFIPSICGFAAGALYYINLGGIRRRTFPPVVWSTLSNFIQLPGTLSRRLALQMQTGQQVPNTQQQAQTGIVQEANLVSQADNVSSPKASIPSPAPEPMVSSPPFSSPNVPQESTQLTQPSPVGSSLRASRRPLSYSTYQRMRTDSIGSIIRPPAPSRETDNSDLPFTVPPPLPEPPEPWEIEEFVAMGFERRKVIWAMQACNNNAGEAADLLLAST